MLLLDDKKTQNTIIISNSKMWKMGFYFDRAMTSWEQERSLLTDSSASWRHRIAFIPHFFLKLTTNYWYFIIDPLCVALKQRSKKAGDLLVLHQSAVLAYLWWYQEEGAFYPDNYDYYFDKKPAFFIQKGPLRWKNVVLKTRHFYMCIYRSCSPALVGLVFRDCSIRFEPNSTFGKVKV